jgi:hypothetical protein
VPYKLQQLSKYTQMSKREKTTELSTKKALSIADVNKRFIIEVFLNDRRLEYRASDNEKDIDKELIELKRAYKSSNCIFYKGELNVC